MDNADRLDLVRLVILQPRLDGGSIRARAPIRGNELRLDARRFAMRLQRVANQPVSNITTRSPGESVLTKAASQAPVPEAG